MREFPDNKPVLVSAMTERCIVLTFGFHQIYPSLLLKAINFVEAIKFFRIDRTDFRVMKPLKYLRRQPIEIRRNAAAIHQPDQPRRRDLSAIVDTR